MIFVITGMEIHPFDRLVQAVDELNATGQIGEEFWIQLGSCKYEPRCTKFGRFISFGELCERVRSASVVITHAGAGSTLTCLQQGKHPILVPRRACYGEHVDDHQLPFTEKFCGVGLATALYDVKDLAATIETVRKRAVSVPELRCSPTLVEGLQGIWTERGTA